MLKILPGAVLGGYGFPEPRLRGMLNNVLSSEFIQEMVTEVGRRKKGEASSSSVVDGGHGGGGGSSSIPGGTWEGDMGSNSAGASPGHGSQEMLDGTTSTSTLIPVQLRHGFMTSLQMCLEKACFWFVRTHFKEVYWTKSHLQEAPEGAELTGWELVISQQLRKSSSVVTTESLHGGAMNEEIEGLLRNLLPTRHDAVHRDPVDAEKIIRYINLSARLIRLFRQYGHRRMQMITMRKPSPRAQITQWSPEVYELETLIWESDVVFFGIEKELLELDGQVRGFMEEYPESYRRGYFSATTWSSTTRAGASAHDSGGEKQCRGG